MVDPKIMDQCIGAFVSFEHQESCDRCVEDYRHSTTLGFGLGFWGWLCRRFQPDPLQFPHPTERDAKGKPVMWVGGGGGGSTTVN